MYKFNSANTDQLVFSGTPVDPLSTPIELVSGWNWIGFTPQNVSEKQKSFTFRKVTPVGTI